MPGRHELNGKVSDESLRDLLRRAENVGGLLIAAEAKLSRAATTMAKAEAKAHRDSFIRALTDIEAEIRQLTGEELED